jgi:preprotein translocase subunit Sec63
LAIGRKHGEFQNRPTISQHISKGVALAEKLRSGCSMWVIYLEALGILAMVALGVWWTMRGKK